MLSRIFGRGAQSVERGLRALYARMLCEACGFTTADAEQVVSQAISLCKEQGRAEGTADLPADYGDLLIHAALHGEPKSTRIIERARREGATDDDVREWWNLPDLCRQMVLWSEDVFRYATFLDAKKDKGLSSEAAAAWVRTMFPIYGDPEDTSQLTGDDRPPPHELRGRVDTYRQTNGITVEMEQAKRFPSYNAFVRDAIRNGLL